MPDIFLSYSREDQPTARRFAEALQRAGFSVWWDQALTAGEAYDKVTEKALDEAGAVVVLWSRKSVDSRWVRAEATQANARGVLVPVMIESCRRPIMFELTHTADLTGWSGADGDQRWQEFVAGVRRFTGAPPATALPVLPVVQRRSARTILAVVVAALFIGGVGLWLFSRGNTVSPPATTAAVAPALVPAAKVTLAVLPFADLSAGKDQEYFSDGLAEELLNQLAQIKGLRVTARTSSFSFKGRNEDVRVIGQLLGVANLLEGSVRKDGRKLRITAQLVSSADGGHLWSKTYDRELSDLFAIQEEVAKEVARALSVTLDVGSLPRLEGGTTNIEAYDKYLKGRELYQHGGALPSREAARMLREAVKLDPQFARAWLLLSNAAAESTLGLPQHEVAVWRKERNEAIAQVLELAPDAWWSRGLRVFRFMANREWSEAEAALPAEAPTAEYEVNVALFTFLDAVGRSRELVQRLEQAALVDPLSFTVSADLQIALDAAGQPARAQAEYERSQALKGTRQRTNVYALMRTLARKDATAKEVGDRFRKLLREEALRMSLSHALAETFQDPIKSDEAIRRAADDPENDDRVRNTVVGMYADRFGQKEVALRALRKGVLEFRATNALWLPYFSGLRADPAFKALVRETGLADFFRASGKWGDYCKPVGADDFECR